MQPLSLNHRPSSPPVPHLCCAQSRLPSSPLITYPHLLSYPLLLPHLLSSLVWAKHAVSHRSRLHRADFCEIWWMATIMKIVTRLSQRIIGKACLSVFFCGDWGGSALSYLPCLNDECTCDFSIFLRLSCSLILVNILKQISFRNVLVWSCIRHQCCTDQQQWPHHHCLCLCRSKTCGRKEITGWQERTALLHGRAAQDFRLCVSG